MLHSVGRHKQAGMDSHLWSPLCGTAWAPALHAGRWAQAYFQQFGPLQEAVIMKDRYTGKSRGFGFVSFQFVEDASRVISTEHHIDGGLRCRACCPCCSNQATTAAV